MSERALPLRGIAVFEAAARSSSFQAAADELNLTPSAVSHQIRLLEDILGVRLFDRIGRGVMLTPDGAEYARSVRQSIRRLRVATSEIRSRGKKGGSLEVVRIEMPPSFAHCWLLPRLPDLMARLPNVDIRVNAQGSHLQGDRTPFPQLADAPADVQIVYGDRDIWEDRASLLMSEAFQPYCSPAFLELHEIDLPQKLPLKMLLSTAQNFVSWDEWLNLQGVDVDEHPIGSVQMDPSHLAIRAARNGVGVILESSVLVAQEVADGTLVPLFPHLSHPGVAYWIYTPSAHGLRPSVEAVREWLKAMVADEGMP
jgi:LysR family transcriptional regulator, glycine cleavage system transcriptional activator